MRKEANSMKRIWLCLAIATGILLLTGYSTYQVRAFADEVNAQLETAADALEQDDFPAAHQAVLKGASLCEEMRRGSVLYLRTEDFIQLEADLRAAASYLAADSEEEAMGALSQAALQAENIDWLTRRWL